VSIVGFLVLALTASITFTVKAGGHEHHSSEMPAGRHEHHSNETTKTTRSEIVYSVPDVRLVRDDEKVVELRDELSTDRTVVLTFIYTSCTTICPITSATLAELQDKLGGDMAKVQIASISIDPEFDTPARLVEYAKRFDAGPNWHHYTGTSEASIAVQRAFDADRGDKMQHVPLIVIRKPGSHSWVRFSGFSSVDELLTECRSLAVTN
jgi:protein SCO1/2